jgi:hypothetical protein
VTVAFDWHRGPIDRGTLITPSYRNTQMVRRFFAAKCGAGFRFDRPFMAWMKAAAGKTMGDAADEWRRRQAIQRATGEPPSTAATRSKILLAAGPITS